MPWPAETASSRSPSKAQATAGWRFGNLIDGTQAEYVLVPDAQANLAPIPDGLTDEQVLMCPDIMSTGFAGAESAHIRIGDAVAVFAQGPIGLCATLGAKLMGASEILVVDRDPSRLEMAKRFGATRGVLATSAAGSMVSSTAVTAGLAGQLRDGPEGGEAEAGGAGVTVFWTL